MRTSLTVSHPQTTLGLQTTDVDLFLPKDTIPGTGQCQAAATGDRHIVIFSPTLRCWLSVK
jgi:hypothetical protein